jgi:hypothetical protein
MTESDLDSSPDWGRPAVLLAGGAPLHSAYKEEMGARGLGHEVRHYQ